MLKKKIIELIKKADEEEIEALCSDLAERMGDIFMLDEDGTVEVIITRKERAERFFKDLFESYQ